MTPMSVREYAEALRDRYLAGTKAEKGRVLTEFCATTSYHRISAIRLLGHAPQRGQERRGRKATYGLAVRVALKLLWEAADRICSKRLVPFLPTLLQSLESHGEIQLPSEVRSGLLALSAATADRMLKPHRQGPLLRAPWSQSRSSSGIRALVPIRTFGEWVGVSPGSLQMDLVFHCGETTEGFHLTTLMAVDVATGWSEPRAVWGKGKDRVGSAAYHVRKLLPFPLLEVHTDNGGEFLNDVLYPYCQRQGIRMTRGRAYKKNDQAVVEQKNWSLIRRLVGYDRYATKAAYEQLERIYRSLRLYTNFFQPLRKLTCKERVGSKLVKHYDLARTPYQRLLGAGVLTEEKGAELEQLFERLNPVKLKLEIDLALEGLWKLAERPGEARRTVAGG